SNNIEIIFHNNAKNLYVSFDKFLIKRVLNNLIINAIDHSKTENKIDVYLNRTGDTFSIDVVDYGEGIDENEIKKIFNKYYTITNKTHISSGLGLYLSNKIIKKHKGILEAESKKGEGSIFRIILPLPINS
ncbi:MAG: ATP-binding protein, partial [Candidatus Gastranaerophilales bacterium]|nr:ATP-binding protein [Candidatus Gastranaerophilales bacterium]